MEMIIYNKLIGGEKVNKDFYIDSIEKIASDNTSERSLKDVATDMYEKYKKFNEKKKDFNKQNKMSKRLLRTGGALTGIAIATKQGKPIIQAIANGGLAGTAIGDIVGSTVLPAKDMYKKHIEEFGTAPDVKSMAKVVGANAIPTAAMWGGIYGVKKGAMKNKLSKNISDGITNSADGFKELKQVFNKYSENPDLIKKVGQKELEKEIKDKMTKMVMNGAMVPFALTPVNAARNHLLSIPGMNVTPDSIIKKKKQEIEQKSIK